MENDSYKLVITPSTGGKWLKYILIALLTIILALLYFNSKFKTQLEVLKHGHIEAKMRNKHITDSLTNLVKLYDNQAVELVALNNTYGDRIDSLAKSLDSLANLSNLQLAKIDSFTFKEDSAYFASKSKSPLRVENNIAMLTPRQLKFANINISENISKTLVINDLNQIIFNYNLRCKACDSLVLLKDKKALALEKSNNLYKLRDEVRIKQLTDSYKKNKKSKRTSFFYGAGVGALATLVAILALVH
jgi:hypothetical protein